VVGFANKNMAGPTLPALSQECQSLDLWQQITAWINNSHTWLFVIQLRRSWAGTLCFMTWALHVQPFPPTLPSWTCRLY
jgi:hypothetical protein